MFRHAKMFAAQVLIVCFVTGQYTLHVNSEPMCTSRFDFEEKLLEKVIRMELVMEAIKGRVDVNLLKVNDDIEHMKLEFKDMIVRTNKTITEMTEYYKNLKDKAEEKLDDTTSEFLQMKTIINESMKDIGVKYENLERKSEMKLDEIKNTAQQDLANIRDLALKKDVVFHVRDIAAQPTANSVIKFTNVVVNTDNVYSLDTGYFTAPRNGTYWFVAQICTLPQRGMSPSIFVRGILISRIYAHDKDSTDCSTVNAVSVMKTGDTATLKTGPYDDTSPVRMNNNYLSHNFMGTLMK